MSSVKNSLHKTVTGHSPHQDKTAESIFMKYVEPLFRPPAEADSLIFQVAYGCPHNHCKFCGMYKTVRYHLRNKTELLTEIAAAGIRYPFTRRVFLADGDIMALPFQLLVEYLEALNRAFPKLSRVNLYANGSSIMMKTEAQLKELHKLKLNTLYMGLESGSQNVLDLFNKTESVEEMIQAVTSAQQNGLKCSVMILIGLGGKKYREEHIAQTISVLNRMQPRQLSALRYILIPGLSLPQEYLPVSEWEAVEELRRIIAGVELDRTVFRANHTSNPVPLSGRFPPDKKWMLMDLDAELNSGALDENGPGALPLSL